MEMLSSVKQVRRKGASRAPGASRQIFVYDYRCRAARIAGQTTMIAEIYNWFTEGFATHRLRSAIFPRWIAFAGYACALVLLLVIANWKWIQLVFPLWMLLLSVHILLVEFRSRPAGTAGDDHDKV